MNEIKKELLEEIYRAETIKVAAKKLGITPATLYSLLDQAGIKRKGLKKFKVV